MENERIVVIQTGAVATVTLNRPEVHNAFDEVMIAELIQAITVLSADSGNRVIVLTGAGPSFCAGADLDWMRRMAAYTREENLADARKLQRLFESIAESPKVTIARVNGPALGGGAGLVAVCDVALAVEPAVFGFTEVRLGLAPAVISPFVVQKIGQGAARRLFLTGGRIPAPEALRIGLVHRVVSEGELDAAVAETTNSVLQSGPNAIAATKRLLQAIAPMNPAASAEVTVDCIADLRSSSEGQEGVRAFLEKRKPNFHMAGTDGPTG